MHSEYQASACAKIILCGEHAVVYGRPAIAIPVPDVRTQARFVPTLSGPLRVQLPDLHEAWAWTSQSQHPVAIVIRKAMDHFQLTSLSGVLTVHSDIPIGGGLGSSASLATAIVRVIAQVAGRPLPPAALSALVYEGEKLWHGTPSGIDNTVIAYEQPIWFVKGNPPRPFPPARAFTLVIADSGFSASTREVVAEVRTRWQANQAHYDALFDAIAEIVQEVRRLLLAGDIEALGPALDENQRLLEALGVSSPVLERLIAAAREAGALGAKLVGAGRGGNILALVDARRASRVVQALEEAGATRVLQSRVRAGTT